MGVHLWVWLVFVAWRLLETYEVHSGYAVRVPLLVTLGLVSPDGMDEMDALVGEGGGGFTGLLRRTC